MNMELFRHNHARFIALSPIQLQFLNNEANTFSYADFSEHIKSLWQSINPNNKNLQIVKKFSFCKFLR